MLRHFILYDGNEAKRIGVLLYNTKNKGFSMSIRDDIPLEDMPLSIELLVCKGVYTVGHEDTLRWVRSRICPPGRQNINSILKHIGLKEYDEFGILFHTKAVSDKDNVYMVEVDE